jgi:hypothetical protein
MDVHGYANHFTFASQLGVAITPIESKTCPAGIEIGIVIFSVCSVTAP